MSVSAPSPPLQTARLPCGLPPPPLRPACPHVPLNSPALRVPSASLSPFLARLSPEMPCCFGFRGNVVVGREMSLMRTVALKARRVDAGVINSALQKFYGMLKIKPLQVSTLSNGIHIPFVNIRGMREN